MNIAEQKAYIFGGLFVLANKVQILGDRINPDLSIKQWLFIAVIPKCQSNYPTISEVAKVMGSSHQNVKKMAAILEKLGFIRFIKDEKDARVIRIALTEKCEEYFKANEEGELQFIEKLFAGFSEEQINGLYYGLQKMASNIIKMEKNNEKEE